MGFFDLLMAFDIITQEKMDGSKAPKLDEGNRVVCGRCKLEVDDSDEECPHCDVDFRWDRGKVK